MGDRYHSMDLVARKSESNLMDAALFHTRRSETLIHSKRTNWSENENVTSDVNRTFNDTFSCPTSPVPHISLQAIDKQNSDECNEDNDDDVFRAEFQQSSELQDERLQERSAVIHASQ